MTRMIDGFDIVNKETKARFIHDYTKNENTAQSIMYAFQHAARTERQLGKDLHSFNMNDIEELAMAIKTASGGNLKRMMSFYKSYTEWCIKRGIREHETGVNFFSAFLKVKQDFTEYIPKVKASGMYLTKEDLDIIVSRLVNAQHKALVLALFEGIKGVRLYELRSLMIENVDPNTNTVIVFDEKGGSRKVEVSDELIGLLFDASTQQKVLKNNGKITKDVTTAYRYLPETRYIFRTVRDTDKEGEMLPQGSINTMIRRIRGYIGKWGMKQEFITPGSIYDSGMIHKIAKAYDDGIIEDINTKEVKKILPELSDHQIYVLLKKFELILEVKK